MGIEITNISKGFNNYKALDNVNLNINTGELVALLGPSGSGKTTLLRIIAGLETADQGYVYFDGEDHTDKRVQERKVGFVFQHYALFQHMTVFENVAFGLKVRLHKYRPNKQEIREKVEELLKLVKMAELANRYPSQLSGGQRQRIALARALAVEPRVLLLDEPFGALDAKVRKDLRRWLRKLHDNFPITSVFVTHDQEEAMDVADRIVILNKGKVEQVGTPEEVYENPVNPFVYDFLGNVNIFHGRIHDGKVALSYARPHDIEIKRENKGGNFIKAKIFYIRSIGPTVHLELKKEEGEEYLEAELNKEIYQRMNFKVGEEVFIRARDVRVFIPEDYVI